MAIALVGGLVGVAGGAAASPPEGTPPSEPPGAAHSPSAEERMALLGPPDPGSGCRPQC